MSVETNINKRWEEGTPHHPHSERIVKVLREYDWKYGNGHLDIECGGDEDNGEHMMFLLDIYFERRDEQYKQMTEVIFGEEYPDE